MNAKEGECEGKDNNKKTLKYETTNIFSNIHKKNDSTFHQHLAR